MGGRVLMIAHHFPPAGGSGANRALAFARYLPDSGWQPIVLTPGVEWAMSRDDGLLRELEILSSIRVIRTESFEQKPAGSGARQIEPSSGSRQTPSAWRSHVGHLKRFPDAHIGWLPFAIAAARKQRYDVAYSSSGPFTSHLVGLLLKRLTRRPWVAELRDGWYRWNRAIFPDYPAWRDQLERRLEAAAIRNADRVVLVTERMAEAFRSQYADLSKEHFAVVSNGFDPLQFATTDDREPRAGWQVVHAGALYYGRSVANVLEAVRCLIQNDADFARGFRLRLVGTLDENARNELSVGDDLRRHVQVEGQVDHAAAIRAMRNADALLLVANTTPGAEATVPGKLFEYLAVGRPILAIAPSESSTRDVLEETGGGWLAAPEDARQIACTLKRAYAERYNQHESQPDPARLHKFDRRNLSRELAHILDDVTLRKNARCT